MAKKSCGRIFISLYSENETVAQINFLIKGKLIINILNIEILKITCKDYKSSQGQLECLSA